MYKVKIKQRSQNVRNTLKIEKKKKNYLKISIDPLTKTVT